MIFYFCHSIDATAVTSNSFTVRGLFSLKLPFYCQIDFSHSLFA